MVAHLRSFVRLSFILGISGWLILAGCTKPTSSQTALTNDPQGLAASSTTANATGAVSDLRANDPPQSGFAGRIIEGPANLRTFQPAENGAAVADGVELNLRAVFEGLGPEAIEWYQHVLTLSNPFFEGRAPGTRGGELAADYVEFYFEQCGLEPAFALHAETLGGAVEAESMTYRQPFDFASPSPKVSVRDVACEINGKRLEAVKDFVVLGISGSGKIAAPVTFVGYALEDGQDGYSSFDADTDLTGRIALVLRYEPLNDEGKSRWSSTRFSRRAAVAPKFQACVARGAAGIILVNPPGAVDGKTELEKIGESSRFGSRLEIPVVQITPEAADKLLREANPDGRDLLTLRKQADSGEIKTVNFDDSVQVALATDLEVDDRLETENVAGVLRGKGSLADQWIVIGGHYDHVGFGYTGSRPGGVDDRGMATEPGVAGSNIGKLHPGADDNASGTAGVIVEARRLKADYDHARDDANLRSIMFVAFGAEEAGLFGSKFLVKNSPIPIESITLMINMDMIGRLRSNNLALQGSGTAEGLAELLQPHILSSGLDVSVSPGGRGPSDHSSFYTEKVPVLFLFTGIHDEYHRPGDKGYTVNPAGAIKVLDLLHSIVIDLADNPEPLKYVYTTGGGTGRDTGARVRLGIQPEYTAELETGVKVEAVSEGTSAADAGILPGDILLSWNDEELTGAQKLFELLGKHQPGDLVRMVLLRGETEMSVMVTLKARQEQE